MPGKLPGIGWVYLFAGLGLTLVGTRGTDMHEYVRGRKIYDITYEWHL